MRLRKKWWARPEMEESPLVITEPREYTGRWKEIFNNDNEIYLELGCGRGEFITKNAIDNPDKNYIAIDLKDEVLVYVLRKIKEAELDNVRIIPLEIAFITEIFDKNEISRIYINFCNPWPKDRHNKRRLTHTRFLEKYKQFIKPGTEIWFKTDNRELFDASLEYLNNFGFELLFYTYDLHRSGFEPNVMTEYEKKFTDLGMEIMFLKAKLKDSNN
ncbi:tRNA (guanine-N(7)-)-methyltransferase [Clostridium pasteurianum DSM 525 = ATCC 6013]|uniref:tRNA (guanine-N(7)-)-methyltransferase n=1 Tax=Clostridium pasteurianum DSM 525 = ATCC 6013 TaxID=1262449 RepID=A0A0H3JAN8_CLOPA|nr:tRNA (guanosine(46)-N7)-methyltransferase TrmB [Clostridium pasteurianum]AJA48730.1 tRNA (guanine-N(7)-)-methyltransferase [Clostridium pasteurianum DSM 525 = ATCC 6013]AJA52718.1 tRNA (guanine-N(7)-)-methyltransferase [Clostridium pasteurianum DSM 525 = ATCC 6013]AOZ75953.1 tRNA (guanine-N7)-methyltransferase [Clostridium pasteurianum DSM 525 = ATCC 6013]AOZ79749.1 tRNA (guanine-N7)-methyltransferase [Clostridium pasteurianum]ELP60029.1 tRNA (guanine-N(7)-)-methyltransferase [Clostridium p